MHEYFVQYCIRKKKQKVKCQDMLEHSDEHVEEEQVGEHHEESLKDECNGHARDHAHADGGIVGGTAVGRIGAVLHEVVRVLREELAEHGPPAPAEHVAQRDKVELGVPDVGREQHVERDRDRDHHDAQDGGDLNSVAAHEPDHLDLRPERARHREHVEQPEVEAHEREHQRDPATLLAPLPQLRLNERAHERPQDEQKYAKQVEDVPQRAQVLLQHLSIARIRVR